MVSLTLMSRLLEAARPEASLVLVGDPDQLASVEAGAVLGDLVGRPPRPGADPRSEALHALLPEDFAPADEVDAELRGDVVRLRKVHRFGADIAKVAEAIRSGKADAVFAALADNPAVELVESADDAVRADVEAAGQALVAAARVGDVKNALAAMDRHRVICGHRRGPYGVRHWGEQVERWIAGVVDDYYVGGEWYVGRPVIATSNDYELRLFNGDTGVVVDFGGERGLQAAFTRGEKPLMLPTNRLSDVETVHALTVHRAQGSQFKRVTVVLPPLDSPLLTRELLYTAVTRAESFVRIIGTADAVRAAVDRPIRRASGLRRT
jgi:exodeoxyribonuclease V alpha subunit